MPLALKVITRIGQSGSGGRLEKRVIIPGFVLLQPGKTIMQDYQRQFLDFAIGRGVLRFGEFTLKSGRVSPYFFNAGLFDSGLALAQLGRYYAATISATHLAFDILFGPAYKGIPLVAAVAVALAEHHDRDAPWCFNRKEAKDHGEGGTIVGARLQGRALIIDAAPRDTVRSCSSTGESRHRRMNRARGVAWCSRRDGGQGSPALSARRCTS